MPGNSENLIHRRALLAGAAGFVLATAPLRAAAQTNPFTDLQSTVGGVVGVAAIDTGTGQLVGHWPDMLGREGNAQGGSFTRFDSHSKRSRR